MFQTMVHSLHLESLPQNGLDDLVKIFDRYGNSITQWEFSQPVEGIEFSQDGRYHTLFSGGRVGCMIPIRHKE